MSDTRANDEQTIDMQQIGIGAEMGNDVLVPDFGQHGTACLFQQHILPFWLLRPTALSAASRFARLDIQGRPLAQAFDRIKA